MSYFRANIDRMQGYQPGEQPRPQDGFIKLNTNENPYPPSPRVIEALRAQGGADVRLYPDPVATSVRRAASQVLGVSPESILVGNGSDELLTIAVRSFVGPGERVIYPTPTYTLYRTLAEIQGVETVEVPFPEDFSLPAGLAEAGGKIIFLANPNSPTGTLVPADEVDKLARAHSGVLVVDEAYVDFAGGNCLDLARTRENVIVLRTFSKSFSLCGVRVGLAVARAPIIEGMMKVKDSYNVNRFAIAAATAALEDIEHMRRNARKVIATRERLKRALAEMDFACYPSEANFVLARVPEGRAAGEIYENLKARKILVRYFDRPRLDDCLRITVGTDDEVDALLDALREEL